MREPYHSLRWLLLVAVGLGYVALQANLIGMAPLLNEVADDLKIGVGSATNLMTIAMFLASFALIFGGFLCDRFGIMSVAVIGHLCGAIPTSLYPWIGNSYHTVLLIRTLQGISGGFLLCLMSPIVGLWFPERERGLASGIMGTAVSLGSAIGVLGAPALFAWFKSWQQTAACFSVFSWIGLAVAIGVFLSSRTHTVSENSPQGAAPDLDGSVFRRALVSPITWVGIFVAFFAQWCLQTLYQMIPSYLAAGKPLGVGFGPMMSGKLMMAVMVTGMVGPIIGGLLQDRVFGGHPKPVMLIGFVLSAFTCAIPFVHDKLPGLVLFLMLPGMGTQLIYPGIVVYVSRSYPMQVAGRMLGLWLGLGSFGGAAGLFVVGFTVATFGSYSFAVFQIALAAICGFILGLFLNKQRESEEAL